MENVKNRVRENQVKISDYRKNKQNMKGLWNTIIRPIYEEDKQFQDCTKGIEMTFPKNKRSKRHKYKGEMPIR